LGTAFELSENTGEHVSNIEIWGYPTEEFGGCQVEARKAAEPEFDT